MHLKRADYILPIILVPFLKALAVSGKQLIVIQFIYHSLSNVCSIVGYLDHPHVLRSLCHTRNSSRLTRLADDEEGRSAVEALHCKVVVLAAEVIC